MKKLKEKDPNRCMTCGKVDKHPDDLSKYGRCVFSQCADCFLKDLNKNTPSR